MSPATGPANLLRPFRTSASDPEKAKKPPLTAAVDHSLRGPCIDGISGLALHGPYTLPSTGCLLHASPDVAAMKADYHDHAPQSP
jgi:hypothetical protein